MVILFWAKKTFFKFMELGLGLRTCFPLETKDPIFVNFKLSPEEQARVQKSLPAGIRMEPVRFLEGDTEASYWISYNLYQLKYPKPELAHIRKGRCEINTFVTDAKGRKGIYVFSGSPYVSREQSFSVFGWICDMAERAVIAIYGCGQLIALEYGLGDRELRADFREGANQFTLTQDVTTSKVRSGLQLSQDYWRFNDISFFRSGRSIDYVQVNSAFYLARLDETDPDKLAKWDFSSPFFPPEQRRRPDQILIHRGEIAYLVNALNPA